MTSNLSCMSSDVSGWVSIFFSGHGRRGRTPHCLISPAGRRFALWGLPIFDLFHTSPVSQDDCKGKQPRVMKIWTSEHTFNHPWETVAQAAWRKYPNPMNPAVIGTDVVDRKVVDGVLHTHRLVSSKWGLPKWVQSIIGPANICFASEHSEVNPHMRHMTLKTRNLTFGKFVAVDEMVRYESHPHDCDKTLLKHEAVVTVQGVPLNNYMEDLLTNTIMANAGKGRQAIEWVIDKINTEVMELKNNAVKSTDEILSHTKKSIDGITSTARKSMDEFSTAAKKSFDELNSLRGSPSKSGGLPKL